MNEANALRLPTQTVKAPALPPGEPAVSPYTPKQADRLGAFRNILRQICEQEQHVRAGDPRKFGFVRDGRMTEVYFRLDGRFLAIWSGVAESMYRTEFAPDEAMRRAALDIVREVKRDFDGPDAMSAKDARDLLGRS